MDADKFDDIVEQALRRIPAHFRRRLHNVAIVVEQEPARISQSHTLLGLYEGRPLTHRSVMDGFVLPDRITIFQGPHERMARSEAHLRKLVADTLWHEIAHYFGMDEQRVRRAEVRRGAVRRRR